MRVCIFASGSGGNCLLVSDGNTNILIDAGISARRVENALAMAGLAADDIGGVFVTHEHSDHVKGLPQLVKKHGMPIFAPRTVAARMLGAMPALEESVSIIPVGESFPFGNIVISAFHTMHDTDESVGYVIDGGGSFGIATDTGCINEEITSALAGVGIVVIESNHDVQMLRDGPYPVYLKKRILSDNGHLSNDDCARFARRLAESGTRQIILGHLSRENNRPAIALETVGAALEGLPVSLYSAPELGFLELEVRSGAVCSV